MVTITIVLALLALVGWLYVERYGNPFELARTQTVVERYLHERYPNTKFTYVKSFFNMKFDTYGGRVVSQGPIPVEFTVERWKQGRFYDDYLSRKLSAEAEAMVAPVVQSVIPDAVTEIWVNVSCFDNCPEDLTFGKGFGLGAGAGITWSNDSTTKEGLSMQPSRFAIN